MNLKSKKIWASSIEENIQTQQWLFQQGYRWYGSDVGEFWSDDKSNVGFFLYDDYFKYTESRIYFDEHAFKEFVINNEPDYEIY